MGVMENEEMKLKATPAFLPGIDLTLWFGITLSLTLGLCLGLAIMAVLIG